MLIRVRAVWFLVISDRLATQLLTMIASGLRAPRSMRIHSMHASLFFFLSGAAVAFGQNASSSSDDPKPISARERLNWVARSTLGPTSLLGASFGAGLSTLTDARPSYGPHWDGFA